MKVVDFLKILETLDYDDETELDILLLSRRKEIPWEFLKIKDICNNADYSGVNAIGIVVTDNSYRQEYEDDDKSKEK